MKCVFNMKFNELLICYDKGWSLVSFGKKAFVHGHISDPVEDCFTFEDNYRFLGSGVRVAIILEEDDFILHDGESSVMSVMFDLRKREEWSLASPYMWDISNYFKESASFCSA